MFNFLKSKKNSGPLDQERRKYFENNLLWLVQEFPNPKLKNRKILTPTYDDFSIQWENSNQNVLEVLKIICNNMQIDTDKIEIHYFDNGMKEVNAGMESLFLQSDPDSPAQIAGNYEEKSGKYLVSLDEGLKREPDVLIATLAHELSHIKLLSHAGLEENDELLTDLATVFFGLGIFNANANFQFSQNHNSWRYSSLGYLQSEEWSYSLALLAFIREELDPHWIQYLNPTIKADFKRSLEFITNNENTVFQ